MSASKFVGIGNPLLDMIVYVKDEELLNKYKLEKDNAILADETHMPIYEEIQNNPEVTYVSGGAGLNTMKMIQWLSEEKGIVSYYGSIGDDITGKKLVEDCKTLGLDTQMIVDEHLKTGKCAVIVHGINRSMVTHLGAAISFNNERITEEMWTKIMAGRIFYMCAYFVNTSMETTLRIAKMASEDDGKLFAFNLSAPFLSTFFSDRINSVLPYVDLLFGNADEISAYAKANKIEGDIKAAARYLQKFPKENVNKHRMVVITNGAKSILLISNEGEFQFDVEKIANEEIVDSNGAGDAFAGGFLKEYVETKDINASIKTATRAAKYILRQSGFQLKDKSNF